MIFRGESYFGSPFLPFSCCVTTYPASSVQARNRLRLSRGCPFYRSVAYFGAYEEIKRLLTPAGASPDHLSPLAVLVAGGSAGRWPFYYLDESLVVSDECRCSSSSAATAVSIANGCCCTEHDDDHHQSPTFFSRQNTQTVTVTLLCTEFRDLQLADRHPT